jgi:hypothetical protein
MSTFVILIGLVVALVVAAAIVHLLLTWMAGRGWVYYRSNDRPRPSSLGLIEEIYQPSMEHVIDEEARERTVADQEASGAPDEPGTASGP